VNNDASDRKYFLLLSKENDFPINAVARDYTNTNPGWEYSIEYFDFNAKNGSSDTKIQPDEYRIWTDGSHIPWANNGEVFYFRSSAVVDGETWYGVLLGSSFAKSSSATDIRDYLPAEDLQVYDQHGNKGFATIADLIRGVVPLTKEVANDDKYNGISREGTLAFFAGADDEHGTNAPVKIYTDGTYIGLDKVEDVQLEGVSLVDENKIAHVDDAVKVSDVKYGNTSLVSNKIAQLDSLQKKLTAGDNVHISNDNVISATDTKYNDFDGSAHGLVPKPTGASSGRYLKEDGTWEVPSGGGGNTYGGNATPDASIGTEGDYYYQYDLTTGDVQITYVKLNDVWHKIAGGDVIIIGGGDNLNADYGAYKISGYGTYNMEGMINGS
jgi:hypothetical protein